MKPVFDRSNKKIRKRPSTRVVYRAPILKAKAVSATEGKKASAISRFGRNLKLKFLSFKGMQAAKKFSLWFRYLLAEKDVPHKIAILEDQLPPTTKPFSPSKDHAVQEYCANQSSYTQGSLTPSGKAWTPQHHHTMTEDSQIRFGTPRGAEKRLRLFIKNEKNSSYKGAEYLRQLFMRNSITAVTLREVDDNCKQLGSGPSIIVPQAYKKIPQAPENTVISKAVITKQIIDIAASEPRKTKTSPLGMSAGEYARLKGFNDPGFESGGRSSFELCHDLARSHGGSNDPSNLFVATAACNTRMMIAEMFVTLLASDPRVGPVTVIKEKNYIPDTFILESLKYKICFGEGYFAEMDIDGLRNDKPVFDTYHYLIIPYQLFLDQHRQNTQDTLGTFTRVFRKLEFDIKKVDLDIKNDNPNSKVQFDPENIAPNSMMVDTPPKPSLPLFRI